MMAEQRWTATALVVGVLWTAMAGVSPVRADGWHNASLRTGSLDQWLDDQLGKRRAAAPRARAKGGANDLQAGRDIEALKRKVQQGAPAPQNEKAPAGIAGRLEGELTPKQQAMLGQKAHECLEILGCMNRRNIIPREFPDFPLAQIPQYRGAAKQMLRLMGPAGGSAVASQLRSELMGMGLASAQGLTPHDEYYRDLLDLLKEHAQKGNVTEQELNDLQQALSGQKKGLAAALAQETQNTLADLKNATLIVLLEWAEAADDVKRRDLLYSKIRAKLDEAALAELVAVTKSKANAPTRQAAEREIAERLTTAGPLELMQALESIDDAALRAAALAALAEVSPRYAEVEQDLAAIWQRADSSDRDIAAAARAQAVNAFLRAPISDCLDWLGKGDEKLNAVIWEQIDDRISRADAERRGGYRDSALAVLGDNDAPTASRNAAIDLLARLKDRQAVGPVIELLLPLPKDLRPRAGKLLKDLTGQDFGPQFGDSTAEVTVSVKHWRNWWKENGER